MEKEIAYHVEYKYKGQGHMRTAQIIRATSKKEAREKLFTKLCADPGFRGATIIYVKPLVS